MQQNFNIYKSKKAQAIVEFALVGALIIIVGTVSLAKLNPKLFRSLTETTVSAFSKTDSNGKIKLAAYGELSSKDFYTTGTPYVCGAGCIAVDYFDKNSNLSFTEKTTDTGGGTYNTKTYNSSGSETKEKIVNADKSYTMNYKNSAGQVYLVEHHDTAGKMTDKIDNYYGSLPVLYYWNGANLDGGQYNLAPKTPYYVAKQYKYRYTYYDAKSNIKGIKYRNDNAGFLFSASFGYNIYNKITSYNIYSDENYTTTLYSVMRQYSYPDETYEDIISNASYIMEKAIKYDKYGKVLLNGDRPKVATSPSYISSSFNNWCGGDFQHKITVHWSDNSNNETGFNIYFDANASGSYVFIGTAAANSTTYTSPFLTELLVDTFYRFKVIPINANGETDNGYMYYNADTPNFEVPNGNFSGGYLDDKTEIKIRENWTEDSTNHLGYYILNSQNWGSYNCVGTEGAAQTKFTHNFLTNYDRTTMSYKVYSHTSFGKKELDLGTYSYQPTTPNQNSYGYTSLGAGWYTISTSWTNVHHEEGYWVFYQINSGSYTYGCDTWQNSTSCSFNLHLNSGDTLYTVVVAYDNGLYEDSNIRSHSF